MTHQFVRKSQTGEPTSNGGHFGSHKRSNDQVNLGQLAAPAGVGKEATVWWVEEVPPVGRQRKPRRERKSGTICVTLPVIAAEDAPVTFRVPSEFTDDESEVREFRTYDGALYWSTPFHDTHATAEQLLGQVASRVGQETHPSKDHAQREAQERLRDIVVIDGIVWERTAEPGYQIRTYGEPGGKDSRTTIGYGIKAADKHGDPWFPASPAGYGTAVHAALELAAQRGDTESMERIPQTKQIGTAPETPVGTFWDEPKFQQGLLEDIRTEIADRKYEGRDTPDIMEKLYAQRGDLVRKLRAAGYDA
ncbi:hypothetical protein [Curtobacterium sp. MCBD17_040]|uniref:hypothetical protein n=1 Tax=Curtobacterium sp. MCBD17_040 TaxID=2175674 RepID=UPI0024DF4E39|nr:hypothetical protein [Curtobacterium sp. MCBD17_040]WIB65432.1 hypothetical protein DEI94_18675 [Curtobacterium sp. MCBD17_040]